MKRMKWLSCYIVILLIVFCLICFQNYFSLPHPKEIQAQTGGPVIGSVRAVAGTKVALYNKFEISFKITNTLYPYPQTSFPAPSELNPYFPYDANPPPGVESGIGITVEADFLPPGEKDWDKAKTTPCFYYQPVAEKGNGNRQALLPEGQADWRCRFTPEIVGSWHYRIRATEAGGADESEVNSFQAVNCDPNNQQCQGFISVSETDPRFFEFSHSNKPLTSPLVSQEQSSPFNSLAEIKTNIPLLGQNGIRFIRWFPTGEGANYFIAPYGDWIRPNWGFGNAWESYDIVDSAAGKKVSFRPYYYSSQSIPVEPGHYRFGLKAYVEGNRVVRIQVGNRHFDICSATSAFHESQKENCDAKQSGWQSYTLEIDNPDHAFLSVGARGLYVSSDAPSPFNQTQDGAIRIHSMQFQKDENGSWGPNLLTKGDPDTHLYVDQRSAARLDEIFRLSEQYGVYHKLTVFHKNDSVLNRFQPDGSFGEFGQCDWGRCPINFYSADGQAPRWYQDAYTRYFIARWAYSTALHSLELGNECGLFNESYQAGWHIARLVYQLSPRRILMTNSFWGYWAASFFTDPEHGHLIDYSDKHWYTSPNDTNQEVISNTWEDSAAYVRECGIRFDEYRHDQNYQKPIVRGEGGVGETNTGPHHPEVAQEPTGTWYHKKLWAHVGILGDTCDGEWYPRLFVASGQFPNQEYDLFKMFSAYEKFITGEPLNNGYYQKIGTDLTDTQQILLTNQSGGKIRAWGVKNKNNGNILLWVDNRTHTWQNVLNHPGEIKVANAALTLQNLPATEYKLEWWNTQTGNIDRTENKIVGSNNQLALTVSNLTNDFALKLINQETSPTSIPLPSPACQADVDGNGKVGFGDAKQILDFFGKITDFANNDISNDGKVNGIDLGKVIADWGTTCN